MATTTTKCRRCGMAFGWENNYGRDQTVWSEHGDPLDCIAVLRHELNDLRMYAVEVKAEQVRQGVMSLDCRVATLEGK